MAKETFVKKSEKLVFYGVDNDGSTTYYRMKGFSNLEKSDNPVEYSRTYVDEDMERSDVVGYAPAISASFDQIVGDEVHDDILDIVDNETIGSGAVRTLMVVDLTKAAAGKAGSFEAYIRNYSVIGDSEGRDDLYNRSVNFKANGPIEKGTATSSDEWATATFTKATA